MSVLSPDPVELFVCDIDGCLSMPYQPYDLERLAELAGFARAAGKETSGRRPPVTICSGRPYAYVEAMSQALGLQVPVVFESGGGMFDPVSTHTTWNPRFTGEVEQAMQSIRAWIVENLLPETGMKLDYDKRTQAGVVGPDAAEILEHLPRVQAYVEDLDAHLHVFHTDVSIDVVAAGITKLEAMQWLADAGGTCRERIAYIGDTNGDLEALEAVGHAFAPANATQAVRETVQFVTEGQVAAGTLEAYRLCLSHNEALMTSSG